MSLREENTTGRLRPLNILRDLPEVADLVELCFRKNLDNEGKNYLQEMRSASKDRRYLKWVSNTMPLKGYVWEAEKKIIGNISIIPFRKNNHNVILLANIAVHPDYRRRGIAMQLTRKGIAEARRRGADSLWLHVEKDNHGAITLYKKLGFLPYALRTTWNYRAKPLHPSPRKPASVTTRTAQFWAKEKNWLDKIYPAEIRWYRMPEWDAFKPGIRHWLYRFFVEYDIQAWAIENESGVQALIHRLQTGSRRTPLWLAASPHAEVDSVATLLAYARDKLASPKRTLTIDYPAEQLVPAFEQAGFTPQRTLLWMRQSLKL